MKRSKRNVFIISSTLANSIRVFLAIGILCYHRKGTKSTLKQQELLEGSLWLPLDSWKGHDPPFENHSSNNKLHCICFYLSFPSAPLMVTAGNNCCSIASEQIIIYEVLAQWLTWYRTWGSQLWGHSLLAFHVCVYQGWPKLSLSAKAGSDIVQVKESRM